MVKKVLPLFWAAPFFLQIEMVISFYSGLEGGFRISIGVLALYCS